METPSEHEPRIKTILNTTNNVQENRRYLPLPSNLPDNAALKHALNYSSCESDKASSKLAELDGNDSEDSLKLRLKKRTNLLQKHKKSIKSEYEKFLKCMLVSEETNKRKHEKSPNTSPSFSSGESHYSGEVSLEAFEILNDPMHMDWPPEPVTHVFKEFSADAYPGIVGHNYTHRELGVAVSQCWIKKDITDMVGSFKKVVCRDLFLSEDFFYIKIVKECHSNCNIEGDPEKDILEEIESGLFYGFDQLTLDHRYYFRSGDVSIIYHIVHGSCCISFQINSISAGNKLPAVVAGERFYENNTVLKYVLFEKEVKQKENVPPVFKMLFTPAYKI